MAGVRSSLGQLVLRLTSPGVPDVYGGDELWFLALVDPDNRRPVDWGRRRRALAGLAAGRPVTIETVKLFAIHELLALRRRRPEAFAVGYEPLAAAEGMCAYRRGEDVVVAVPLGAQAAEPELAAGTLAQRARAGRRPRRGRRPGRLRAPHRRGIGLTGRRRRVA